MLSAVASLLVTVGLLALGLWALKRFVPGAVRADGAAGLPFRLLVLFVVTGAGVRLTGSGLGCTDWPNCTDTRFVAPLELHPMVEFVNRLITGAVSVAVVLAVLGSRRRSPRRRDLTLLSWGLVAGVVAQILLGAVVVLSHLNPWLVQGHFVVSMLLVLDAEHPGGPHRDGPRVLPARGARALPGRHQEGREEEAGEVEGSSPEREEEVMFAPLEALRPKQWTKNLLLFVGVIFSQHLSDMALLQRAMAGFVAFSLLSGSVYVLNDLMDVEADRQHPKKCKRPIASGRLPVPLAWGMLPVILAAVAALHKTQEVFAV